MPQQGLPTLPKELVKQLQDFRHKLRKAKIIEILSLLAILVSLSVIIFFLSDRLWNTPTALQYLLSLFALFSIILLLPFWFYMWVWNRRQPTQLAKLIGKSKKSLGDDLLGVIELENQNTDNTSKELRLAAMKQVANQVSDIDLSTYIPKPFSRSIWSALIICLVVLLILSFSQPEAIYNTTLRFLMPHKSVDRFTYTQFDHSLGRQHIVPLGEQSILNLQLSEDTRQKPQGASFKINNNEWLYAPLTDDHSYSITLPPLQEPTSLSLHVGDVIETIKVIPMPRPALTESSGTVHFPSYTTRKPMIQSLRAGTLQALKGSKVDINLTTNHEIKKIHITDKTGTPLELNTSIKGNVVQISDLDVNEQNKEMRISFTDGNDLTSTRPVTVKLQSIEDKKPQVKITNTLPFDYVLENQSITFQNDATDDYGVKELGIEWMDMGKNSIDVSETLIPSKQVLVIGAPDKTQLKDEFVFIPKNYGFNSHTLQFRTFAKDYHNASEHVYSNPITITVLSFEEHIDMIKKNIESLGMEVDDIIRNLFDISDKTSVLNELSEEDLAQPENLAKFQELAQDEQFIKQQTELLSKRMQHVFDDAARNTRINKDTLKQLMEALNKAKNTASNELTRAQENLQSASNSDTEQSARATESKKSSSENASAIRQFQDIAKLLKEAESSMEADSFIARLKILADNQEAVSQNLKNRLSHTAGNYPKDLPPSLKNYITETSLAQKNNYDSVEGILTDLKFYIARSKNDNFNGLYQKMTQYGINDKLSQLINSIEASHTLTSTDQSIKYAKQINDWVMELLDQEQSGGGGGGGGGGQEQALSDEEFEVFLQLIRLMQKQQEIRSETRQMEKLQPKATPQPQPKES